MSLSSPCALPPLSMRHSKAIPVQAFEVCMHPHTHTHSLTRAHILFTVGLPAGWGEVGIKVVEMMSSVPNLWPFLEVHQIKSESIFFARYSIREVWHRKCLLQVNPYLVLRPNCPSGKFKLYSIINLDMHLIINILNLSHFLLYDWNRKLGWDNIIVMISETDLRSVVQIWFLKCCYQGMLALFHRGHTEPKLQ